MPKVYSPRTWQDLLIETHFLGTQAKFSRWPFYVGDHVQFHVRVTQLGEKSRSLQKTTLWEKLPQDSAPRAMVGFNYADHAVSMETDSKYARQIEEAGNVSYYVGNVGEKYWDGVQIISADAEHTDRRDLNCVLFVIVPIFVLILGIILGLLLHF